MSRSKVQVDLNNMFPHGNVFKKFYRHRTMEKYSQGIFTYIDCVLVRKKRRKKRKNKKMSFIVLNPRQGSRGYVFWFSLKLLTKSSSFLSLYPAVRPQL